MTKVVPEETRALRGLGSRVRLPRSWAGTPRGRWGAALRVTFGSGVFRLRPGPERRGEPRTVHGSRTGVGGRWERGRPLKGERLRLSTGALKMVQRRGPDTETLGWPNFSVNKPHLQQRAVLQL